MRVLIMFDRVSGPVAADHADVLTQVRAVGTALDALGHEWMTLGVTLDLAAVGDALARLRPDIVFNLVESLGGSGRLLDAVPALLDILGIPYTGAAAETQFITSNKPLAKQLMATAQIATPPFITIDALRRCVAVDHARPPRADQWILKSVWEHASIGLDAQSVIDASDPAIILRELKARMPALGGAGFAEAFIDGREFCVGLLAHGWDPVSEVRTSRCLPPAEIVYRDFPPARPRILDYAGKWNEASFEYRHTVRVFDFAADDQPLLDELMRIAQACWDIFALRGYARVDFRVDRAGSPWVLEVNTNPCLSPDAGFAAALARGGIAYPTAIERILEDALRQRQV